MKLKIISTGTLIFSMIYLISAGLCLLLLAVSMKVFSGEQFDNWVARVTLVDGYQVKYVYPENAFFYNVND